MKLIACHIENFGKLSNLSMEFSEGINVINEANAWGKSTLAAFLKVMFYGLDSKKEAGAFEKERVLYRPWQGGSYGGELDFEVDGKRYRISRTFGATEKTDQFHLYDLSTNLESYDYSEEIGVELFDLDSASFKRSVYIAQNDCASETSDRINAKLGNIAENTDDINNFESANRRMKELLNQLTPDRVTGSIKKRKNYITQLTQELRIFDAAQDGLSAVLQKEQLVSSQIQELLDIRKNYAAALVVASEDSRKKELYAQYDVMCKEVDDKEQKKASLEVYFPNGVPTTEEFQEQMKTIRSMEEKRASAKGLELTLSEYDTWGNLKEMFEQEVPTEKKINASLESLTGLEKEKNELVSWETRLAMAEKELNVEVEVPDFKGVISPKILLFMGLGVLITSVAGFAAWYFKFIPNIDTKLVLIASVVAFVLGAILLIVGFVKERISAREKVVWMLQMKEEHEAAQQNYDQIAQQVASLKEYINRIHSAIGAFLGRFHIYCKVDDYPAKLYELKNHLHEYQRLLEKMEEGIEEKNVYDAEKKKVLLFAEKYGFSLGEDFTNSLNALQNRATEYQMALAAYNEVFEKRAAFEQRQDKSFWTREALCPYSLDELNQMIESADLKLEELKTAKTQYTKQLEDLQEQLDLRDEKKEELEEQQRLQDEDIKKYNLIKVTQEYLQRAKEQFTAKYMEPIAKGFSKYYQMLTGDDKGDWMIDANIRLQVREQGELRDTKWLSAGYQDLIGVCMRLALVDAMYEEEKPFLILDDPFVNLDKEKVECGNELLLSVANEYQIIYFTCHDSRSPV